MTNFEFYTASPARLETLLEMAVNDALEAEGCSNKLTQPPDRQGDDGEWYAQSWAQWLEEEL